MPPHAGSGTSEEERPVDDGTVSVADDVHEIARMRNESAQVLKNWYYRGQALVLREICVVQLQLDKQKIACNSKNSNYSNHHIKDEVIEESIRQYYHHVDATCDVKDFAADKFCYFPKYMLRKMKEHLSSLLAVVTLTSKCLGEIFACTFIGYTILSFIFAKTILFTIFIYVALPAFAVTLIMKTPNNLLTAAERHLLILILAFTIGAGTHHLLLNWKQPEFAPPPFYSPVIVALLFEFVCPRFTSDRRLFLLSSVGVAGTVCFAYGLQNGLFNFTYFYTSVFAIVMSFYNMQILIADPKEGWGDSIGGLVLLPINSMYNQLVMTILFGSYIANRHRQEAIPDSIEEQYSLLLWPKK